MSLYEASFKVKHECPYRTLSDRYPELTIREWFMNDHQVLEVAAPSGPPEELLADVDALGTVLYDASDDDGVYAVVRSQLCSREDTLLTRFEDHNCLYLPPTVYRAGWEHYTVTAFEEGDVRALLGALDADRDVEVLSRKALEVRRVPHSLFTTVDALFDGLTPHQLEALRLALDHEYFEQPRGASIAELADRTTVSRSTYEEHLRKATNKLIANAENFVRLLTEDGDPSGLREESTPTPTLS